MARKFSYKKRGSSLRIPKPLLLLIAEGRNVTETQFFSHFNSQQSPFVVKVITPGSATDPSSMLKTLERHWDQNDMSFEKGDRCFVVLDLDCDETKAHLIEHLKEQSLIARFAVSNPCFEVWFLLHFRYTTHEYTDGTELIRDLQEFIPEYRKTTDVMGALSGRLDFAMGNAAKLEEHYRELRCRWPSNECNPRTDVPEIIRELMNMGSASK